MDPVSRKCVRHQQRECFNADCAHYVWIESSPFCCEKAKKIIDLHLPQTWIQVSRSVINFINTKYYIYRRCIHIHTTDSSSIHETLT